MRFLADENFDGRILRGIQREDVMVDIVRAQDTELYSVDDATVLEWAYKEKRIVLTHDINTIPKYAYERLQVSKSFSGIIIVPQNAPLGEIISDLVLIIGAASQEEFLNQIVYLPLK